MTGIAVSRPGLMPLAAVVAAMAWAAAVATLGPSGPAVALAPLIVGAAGGGLLLLLGCARGRSGFLAILLVVVVFGLSISFRSREFGEAGLDWQNGLKLAVWLLIPILAYVNRSRFVHFLNEPALRLALIYGAVACASALWSQTPAYTAGNALGLFAYLLLACLLVSTLAATPVLRLMVGTLAAFAIVALAAGIVLPEMAWLPPGEGETIDRLRGLSGHPNVLGEQMAILLTLAVIMRREGALGRPAFLACLGLALTALALSNSRITLAAALSAWAVVALRRRGLLSIVAVGLLSAAGLGCFVLAFGGEAMADSVLRAFSRSGSLAEIATLTGRTDLWAVAFERIAERPLLGWGFNGTEALFVEGVGRGFVGDPANAHNMYIQSLMSIGVLGSLPVFAMLAVLVHRMVARPEPGRDQITLLILMIGLGEISILGTPMMLALTLSLFLAREAASAQPGPFASWRSTP